jgi:hypothetical protein
MPLVAPWSLERAMKAAPLTRRQCSEEVWARPYSAASATVKNLVHNLTEDAHDLLLLSFHCQETRGEREGSGGTSGLAVG